MMIKEQAINNLKDIKQILDKLGITFWLDFGTCLGAYRDKDFCQGDEDDTDLGIWAVDRTSDIIREAEKKGFEVLHNWENEITLGRGENRVDLFFYHNNGEESYTNMYTYENEIANYVVIPTKLLEKLELITFHKLELKVPSPVEDFLEVKYGDWKTPIGRDVYKPSDVRQHKAIRITKQWGGEGYKVDYVSQITAIIATFKRPDCLEKLLTSIKEFYPNLKTIIYDDSDTDKGLSWSRNHLVSQVKTPYYLLLDDDFIFTEDTKIENLLKKLRQGYDIVGGALFQQGEIIHFESRLEVKDDVLHRIEVEKEPFDTVLNFFLARREVKGWDNELKMGEHLAFFWDNKGKWRISYEPKCIIKHERGQFDLDNYMFYRSRAFGYQKKWLDKKGFKRVSPDMVIPRIIHQFWVGDSEAPMEWINTWKDKNKYFYHILWDEKKIKEFGLVNQDKYDQYYKDKCYNGCSDVARYEILKKYGGLYIDADCNCLESLDYAPFMTEEFFACWEGDNHWFDGENAVNHETDTRRVLTSPIGSIPNHPILDECIKDIRETTELYPPWKKVANVMLSNILKKHEVCMLPPYTFMPTHHDGSKANVGGKVYSEHFFGTTRKLYFNQDKGYERIDDNEIFNNVRESHEYRYKLAGKFVGNDKVLDVACGTTYGKRFLGGEYIGVDKAPFGNIVADLNNWQPDFEFDVGVSFETIEHLENPNNLIEILKKAKKYIIYSSPIVPTKHTNPFHLQDFTYEELRGLFSGWGDIVHEEKQDEGIHKNLYGIFVIKKNDLPKGTWRMQ